MADIARKIAGYLTHNPGPGIYSRLERAVEAMPENVRVQELPGLLKRYKEGVPGWELKAADLDSVIAGRDVVPREELLSAVRERSPVYTHREVVLGGNQPGVLVREELGSKLPTYQNEASKLGAGISHAEPKYEAYGQGGQDYAELLLLQPGASGQDFGSHYQRGSLTDEAVAHARYDTHGDALRINELQSDLGIHNRKAREYADQNPQIHFGERLNPPEKQGLPFPLEDAWADLLIKRLALEAARKGHRAIEVASPRAIADKVGGNIENYEHFYGKVVPGALERLGRKMGGMVDDSPRQYSAAPWRDEVQRLSAEQDQLAADMHLGYDGTRAFEKLGTVHGTFYGTVSPDAIKSYADRMYRYFLELGASPEQAAKQMTQIMPKAGQYGALVDAQNYALGKADAAEVKPTRRYIMSDEMRRRLIQEGVGAAVAGGIMSQDDLIERLNQ